MKNSFKTKITSRDSILIIEDFINNFDLFDSILVNLGTVLSKTFPINIPNISEFTWIIPKKCNFLQEDISNTSFIGSLLISYYYITNWYIPTQRNELFMKLEPFFDRSIYKRMVMAFAYGMTYLRSHETIVESVISFIINKGFFNVKILDLNTMCHVITKFFIYYYIPTSLKIPLKFLEMNKPISKQFMEPAFELKDDFIMWSFTPREYISKRLFGKDAFNKRKFSLRIQVPNKTKLNSRKLRTSICPIIIHYADSNLARIIWKNIYTIQDSLLKENIGINAQLYKIHDSFSCNMLLAPIFKDILKDSMEEHLQTDWFKTKVYPSIENIKEVKDMFEQTYCFTANKLTKVTNPYFVRV